MSSDSKPNRRAAKETQAFQTRGPLPQKDGKTTPGINHEKKSPLSSAGKLRKQSMPDEVDLQVLSDSIEQDARRYPQRFPA